MSEATTMTIEDYLKWFDDPRLFERATVRKSGCYNHWVASVWHNGERWSTPGSTPQKALEKLHRKFVALFAD